MKRTIPGISDSDRELLLKSLPQACSYIPRQETLEMLLDMGNTVLLDKGDALINAGECDPNLYITSHGLLRCWFWNNDKEETAFFSNIPTLFFDYHSFCGNIGSFYCYEACTEARVIRILKHDYERLNNESHDLTLWMLTMAQCQHYHFECKARNATGDATERYASLIKHIPRIINKVPLHIIASYLKITPQHLSRIRRKS